MVSSPDNPVCVELRAQYLRSALDMLARNCMRAMKGLADFDV
jgi:hypothetical protein